MLKLVRKSQALKTTDIAVTYRSGIENVFGSCPKICPLNPVQDKSTSEIDWNYLKAVLNAVPKKGKAFTFTHFKLENEPLDKLFLLHDIKVNENTTTINRSTDNLDDAIAVHKKMFPTTITLSDKNVRKNFTYKNVKFVRCPAEYNKKITCKNCQLCTRKLRDFVIVFYANGSQNKLVGDQNCKLFSDLYKLQTVCLRYSNAYCENQPTEGSFCNVMGIFEQQKQMGKPMTIVGDGEQRRDFIHVNDIVDANIKVGFTNKVSFLGDVYNVGSGKNYSVNEIAEWMGGETEEIPPRVEPKETLLNSDKLKSTFDWKPTIDLKKWLKQK